MKSKDLGGWCSIQVQDESHMDLQDYITAYLEYEKDKLEILRRQGLAAYVKYNYYTALGLLPDELLNALGYVWALKSAYICVGSTVQSLVNTGDMSKRDYYMTQNGKFNLIGYGEGIIESIYGGLEGLLKSVVRPFKNIYDIGASSNTVGEKITEISMQISMLPIAFCMPGPGEIVDVSTKEGFIDTTLARLYNVTGTPIYTIKEAIDKLNGMTPEEREEWENQVFVLGYQLYDKYILHCFTEEVMTEIYSGLGAAEGFVTTEIIKAILAEKGLNFLRGELAARKAGQAALAEEMAGVSKDGAGVGSNTKSGFKYQHNPSNNPKVLKDAYEDPSAIYGYKPRKDGSLAGLAEGDWTNPDYVEVARRDRIAYHERNESAIMRLVSEMREQGYADEQIARTVSEYRNQSRLSSYMDADGNIINQEGYDMAMSHYKTYEDLINEGKTAQDIIESATRGNPAMDACTGLYDDYFDTYLGDK